MIEAPPSSRALVTRLLVLAVVNAGALWGIQQMLAADRRWWALLAGVALVLLDVIYLGRRTVAARYLYPATLLLVVFALYPLVDTVRLSLAAGDAPADRVTTRAGLTTGTYRELFAQAQLRGAFLHALVWTALFALISVVAAAVVGIFLAVALHHERLRGQRVYRSLLVLPYALPLFATVLLWRALLDDRAGILNRTLGWSVPWLDEAGTRSLWPYVSILLVNLWLSYPYVFLVASRALRALPSELVDAARLEGVRGLRGFRRVTFPLLLPVLAPVLVAAFAFNVASFTLVHLLTSGIGATSPLARTDLLVNAAWRLAFDAGGGPQLGLAAAVSVVVFIVVALVSALGVGLARPVEVRR